MMVLLWMIMYTKNEKLFFKDFKTSNASGPFT